MVRAQFWLDWVTGWIFSCLQGERRTADMTGGFNARGLTWLFFPPGTLKNLPFYLKSRTTNGGAFIAWQIPNCPNGKREP